MSKFLLRGLNGLVSLAVGLCLAVCGAYAAYALWDNQQIYSAAEDVQRGHAGIEAQGFRGG